MPLTPNNREEHWLQGMVDGQTTLEPNKRREFWYKEIVDAIGSGGGGGAGGGVLVVNATMSGSTVVLDKTYKEITSVFTSGGNVVISLPDRQGSENSFAAVVFTAYTELGYRVAASVGNSSVQFHAATEDDYPFVNMG